MWEKINMLQASPWDTRNALIAAISTTIIGECLDCITSILGSAYITGSVETNVLFRDPATLKFVVGKALILKFIYLLIQYGIISTGIYIGTKSYLLASIPWFYRAFGILGAVYSNTVLLVVLVWWRG